MAEKGGKSKEVDFKGQMNDVIVDRPNVKWDDISGLAGAKAALK